MKNSFISLLIILLLAPAAADAQKQKAERAYEAFKSGNYFEATDLFKNVYSKTRDKQIKAEMVFMVSECYRIVNDPKNAELWYKKAVKSAFPKPEAQYWLAESIKKNGRYEQAIEEFKKYRQLVPGDPRTCLLYTSDAADEEDSVDL